MSSEAMVAVACCRLLGPSSLMPSTDVCRFKQKGDAPDGIYIIKAGRMRVHVGSANVAV